MVVFRTDKAETVLSVNMTGDVNRWPRQQIESKGKFHASDLWEALMTVEHTAKPGRFQNCCLRAEGRKMTAWDVIVSAV